MNRVVTTKDWDNITRSFICMDGLVYDNQIANLLHMDEEEYQQYLIKNFNGQLDEEDGEELALYEDPPEYNIYFIDENDAKQALEWIESVITLKKLGG